jgi:hypothetical protein
MGNSSLCSLSSVEPRDIFVNVAADFTSVVEMLKSLGGHDGRKVRRYIHEDIS